MKRGGALQRTPMPQRSARMTQRKELTRAGKSPEVPARSRAGKAKTRSPQVFPAAVQAQLAVRDGCCQRCGSARDLERHHRRLKGIGGSRGRPHAHCACNGVTLCRPCHRWAHVQDRPAAEAEGFIVSQSVTDPASAGVMRFSAAGGGATQWSSCDGRWLATAAEAREAA